MTKQVGFTKMHGAGNDYIYINTMRFPIDNPSEVAISLSRPHFGIGSDGLVLIGESEKADFSMRIFNADGSEAMMCGNASRCIGKYVYENGLTDKTSLTLETLSGIKVLQLHVNHGLVESVTVDMGRSEVSDKTYSVTADGRTFVGREVSMGNPHFVIFVQNAENAPLFTAGPLIEHDAHFPDRTNVEFASIQQPEKFRMRVWERGSGVTLACGTGACATVAAAIHEGLVENGASVTMDGGTLSICIDKQTGHVMMTGNAVKVFEGVVEIPD